MSGQDQVYFNFPIEFLEGFMENTNKCFDKILYHGICSYAVHLADDSEERDVTQEDFELVAKELGVKLNDVTKAYNDGCDLCFLHARSPKVGISRRVLWDFYNNEKTDFEKFTLLAYLAAKSIVQNKVFCRVTNSFWVSRMAGASKVIPGLSEALQSKDKSRLGILIPGELFNFISKPYRLQKVKRELEMNWGLKYFAHQSRGTYMTFEGELEDLVKAKLENTQAYKDKLFQAKKKKLLEDFYKKYDPKIPPNARR